MAKKFEDMFNLPMGFAIVVLLLLIFYFPQLSLFGVIGIILVVAYAYNLGKKDKDK